MKIQINFVAILMFSTILTFAACDGGSGGTVSDIDVSFSDVTQTGGISGTSTTTGLTLTFSVDPTTLDGSNITVIGATKGDLSGSGKNRSLAISDITVANAATVSVTVTSPGGYAISGSPQTAVVYRSPYIGMPWQGGVVAYIFQPGDTGYEAGVHHGLIAATSDQSSGSGSDIVRSFIWAIEACEETAVQDGTGTAIGTGFSNTTKIIDQNGAGITYAAGLARAHDGGGYSDWYLPSLDELNKLYENKDDIGGFVEYWYWSSSESEATHSYRQKFTDGSSGSVKKWNLYKVRAVRNF